MVDFNFAVSTEGLHDKGKEIGAATKEISDCIDSVNEARKLLEAWRSLNKEKYDNKLGADIPSMLQMVDTLNSFSNVAVQTSARLVNVENKIAAAIDNDDIAA